MCHTPLNSNMCNITVKVGIFYFSGTVLASGTKFVVGFEIQTGLSFRHTHFGNYLESIYWLLPSPSQDTNGKPWIFKSPGLQNTFPHYYVSFTDGKVLCTSSGSVDLFWFFWADRPLIKNATSIHAELFFLFASVSYKNLLFLAQPWSGEVHHIERKLYTCLWSVRQLDLQLV